MGERKRSSFDRESLADSCYTSSCLELPFARHRAHLQGRRIGRGRWEAEEREREINAQSKPRVSRTFVAHVQRALRVQPRFAHT